MATIVLANLWKTTLPSTSGMKPAIFIKSPITPAKSTTEQQQNNSPVLDRVDVEVDKPVEGVLVHWVYVGQISDAEEQDGRVLGNVPVTLSRLCNLFLCLFCDLCETNKRM